MKKCVLIALLCLSFCLPFCLVGCSDKVELNSYTLQCEYNQQTHSLECSQTVDYVNTSQNMLSEVCFHLYPNAFREGAKAKVVSQTSFNDAYYNGQSYGNINILDVQQNDKVCGYQIGGEDENILIVNLSGGLFPDERVTVKIDFNLTLPNVNHRFGYGENTINFGNFYPVACVYENGKGFAQDLYHSNGDPFYSDCSNYKVQITYPENFVLASSGQQKSTTLADGKKTTQVEASKIRDFAFVLSDKFDVATKSVDGVQINYYYYDDPSFEQSLQAAVDAVKTFDQTFGKYPYAQLSVVKSNFVHGGMEYPNLVLISDAVKEAAEFNYVIVHEVAHQWWYGVVGNNECDGAWQDEGLAEYSTLVFYQKNEEYGQNYNVMIKAANSSYKLFVEIYSRFYDSLDTSMNRRIDQFQTEPEYTNCTYTKGVLMFDCLRQTIGEKKFFKALKGYYKDYAFKNASNEELIASFIKWSGVDLESFFASWLDGTVVIL